LYRGGSYRGHDCIIFGHATFLTGDSELDDMETDVTPFDVNEIPKIDPKDPNIQALLAKLEVDATHCDPL
jgi:hypothetical protein